MSNLQKPVKHLIEKGYTVITFWRGGSVVGYVEHKKKKVTDEVLFATESGAVDYWFDKYYHGKI